MNIVTSSTVEAKTYIGAARAWNKYQKECKKFNS